MPLSLTTLPEPSYITPLLVVRRGPAFTDSIAARTYQVAAVLLVVATMLPFPAHSSLKAGAVDVPSMARSTQSNPSMGTKAHFNLISCHFQCATSAKEAEIGTAAILLFGMPADSRMAGTGLDFDEFRCKASRSQCI